MSTKHASETQAGFGVPANTPDEIGGPYGVSLFACTVRSLSTNTPASEIKVAPAPNGHGAGCAAGGVAVSVGANGVTIGCGVRVGVARL